MTNNDKIIELESWSETNLYYNCDNNNAREKIINIDPIIL